MNPEKIPALVLDKIRNLPEYNLTRAKSRYCLIKKCEKYLAGEVCRLKQNYRKKTAIKQFCRNHDLSLTTFYRWRRLYRRNGITGLAPKYGNQRKLIEQRKASFRRPASRAVEANIQIDVLHPFTCLQQINQIVQSSPKFDPFVKLSFEHLVESLNVAHDGGNALLLPRKLSDEEREKLYSYLYSNHKKHSARALGLLMMDNDCSLQEIIIRTQHSRTTIFRWRRHFEKHGLDFIVTTMQSRERESAFRYRAGRVVEILHTKPSEHGISRSSWSADSIRAAYEKKYGESLSAYALKAALKYKGCTLKRARTVLISKDPLYKEKVKRLVSILHELTPGDAFFFIDEAGPWRVKKYGGRQWSLPGEIETLPDKQPDKGSIYMIAALEAQTNQVLWQFIKGKTATSLVKMLDEILEKYRAYSRIFLTWDALSSHNSKKVNNWIGAINFKSSQREGYPRIEVCALPTSTQFLNVVESTFSNIRKAVIHNSDYQSVEEMKQAINTYLEERNNYFKANPRRAGNKIWDKELFKPEDLPGGLYRRM